MGDSLCGPASSTIAPRPATWSRWWTRCLRWAQNSNSGPNPRMQSFSQFIAQAHDGQVLTTAPCRADLAGGTIDIWPLYLFHRGAVSVNIALDIQTACLVTPRDDREIHLKSHDTG